MNQVVGPGATKVDTDAAVAAMSDVHYSGMPVPAVSPAAATPAPIRTPASRGLVRNSALNLSAQVVLAVMALVAARFLFPALGAAQFGVLTLAWTAIGYFSVFDLALGRALTHAIATGVARGNHAEMQNDVWSGLTLLAIMGVVGGGVLAVSAPSLVNVLKIPPELHAESRMTFLLLAVALPFTIVTSGLRGIIEGFQDFGTATALRLPIGVLTYGGPMLVLLFSKRLVPIIAVLAVGRIAACILHAVVCWYKYAFLHAHTAINRARAIRLLRFGGWMSVSNVVSPLMVNLDRFLIGALLPVAAIGYYVMPYEAVTKVWLIPTAILAALFPALVAAFAMDRVHTAILVDRGIRAMLVGVFPLCLLFVALGHEALGLWLGAEFAAESTRVMQWLAAGVLINCVGQVAFAAVQAGGRPDVTGKLHLFELPLYALLVWWLTSRFGLVGVAVAWVLRVAIDTAGLLVVVCRQLPEARGETIRASAVLSLLVGLLAITATISSFSARVAVVVVAAIVCPVIAWLKIVQPAERVAIRHWMSDALSARRRAEV